MHSDKERTIEAQTLGEGVALWQNAPQCMKEIYKVRTDSFEQTYSLLSFIKKSAPGAD